MDDLLIYLIALLAGDAQLLATFDSAGATSVTVLSPEQRTMAVYPKLIVSGDQGHQVRFGDVLPQFFDGTLRIESVCRLSDSDVAPLDTLRAIESRIDLLVLGNRKLGIQGLMGTVVSANYRVDGCYQHYARLLPSGDQEPTIYRWGASYYVKLNNLGV